MKLPKPTLNADERIVDSAVFPTTDFNISEKIFYSKPKLINYGKVTNLTKGTGSHEYDEGSIVENFY